MCDLKILFPCSFYDAPLNGLAMYNGEKVWFHIESDPESIGENESLPEELLSQFTPDEQKLIKKMRRDDPMIMKGYHLVALLYFYKSRSYKLYRLPADILLKIETWHEMICKDHTKYEKLDVNFSDLECIDGVFYEQDFS